MNAQNECLVNITMNIISITSHDQQRDALVLKQVCLRIKKGFNTIIQCNKRVPRARNIYKGEIL